MILSILSTDPNLPQRHITGISRRFIVSAALLSCAIVLLGFPLLQLALALATPPVFEYINLPYRVCDPAALDADLNPDDCVHPREPFHPGDVVPFVVERVVHEPFAAGSVIPYTVSRNLVRSTSGVRIILDSLATTVPTDGYGRSVTLAHSLPQTVPPGTYYLEGVATVYGRVKTSTSYFRTEDFEIAGAPRDVPARN